MNEPVNLTHDARGVVLQQLRRLVEGSQESRVEGQEPDDVSGPHPSTLDSRLGHELGAEWRLSSGVPAIDRLLPGGGLRRGILLEWVGGMNDEARMTNDEWKSSRHSSFDIRHSSFSTTLSLLAAREASQEGGVLVVIDRERTFYPPAAAAWGIDLQRLVVVRPASARDHLWAAVQSLRSPAVAAVWTAIARLDDRAFRRLQLAAQAGGTLGVLVRPASALREPSWADVRLEIGQLSVVRRPLPSYHGPRTTDHGRSVDVRILRCRQGRAGGTTWLEIDDVLREVNESPRLSAVASRPSLLPTANG